MAGHRAVEMGQCGHLFETYTFNGKKKRKKKKERKILNKFIQRWGQNSRRFFSEKLIFCNLIIWPILVQMISKF